MMAQFAVVKPHTAALPPGYFLASTRTPTAKPGSRTPTGSISMAGMATGPMPPPGAGTGSPVVSRSVVARAGEALLTEAAVILLLVGLRRFWRFA
jgi:hypothetical protein